MELNEFSTLENVLRDLYWVKNLVISHWSKCRPIKGNPSQSWILGFHAADFGFHCSLDFWWVTRRRQAFLSAAVAVQSLSPPRRFRLCGEYCTPNFMIFGWRWLILYLVLLLTNPKARSGQCEKIQFFLFKYLDCVAFGKARRGRLFRTGLTWPNWPLRSCLIL